MSTNDPVLIHGIDHLHLIVGNALQSSYFYRAAFGFSLTGYRGPETGTRDHASYVLEQGSIRLVLSSPLAADSPMHEHIRRHGDGVRDIAFAVDDPAAAWKTAVERGAEPAYEPSAMQDNDGVLRMAGINACGDTIHSFVGRKDYGFAFRPGFCVIEEKDALARPAGLLDIDHIVLCLDSAGIAQWAAFYENVLGFTRAAGKTGLSLSTGQGGIRLALREQDSSDFLDSYQGPGVCSITLTAPDCFQAVALLRSQGVAFPEVLALSEGDLRAPTKPVSDRSTLRFEIVERKD